MTLETDLGPAYEEALNYLYSFINFEQRPHDRYMASKLDAARPLRLMQLVGNPHQQFRAIHIAGTKGKGSVAAMCASSLQAAGLRVGLYTSPHLQEFRERIRILTPEDPVGWIPVPDLIAILDDLKPIVAEMPGITWFEILTAVAFLHFARQQVDVAVVEVGLGGRLDATNVLTPMVSVITSLSLDHTKLLGNTLTEIAYEKGGIIKRGVPVVIAPQADEARQKLVRLAVERQSALVQVGTDWQFSGADTTDGQTLTITRTAAPAFIQAQTRFVLPLLGDHQLQNATVALAALALVQPYFPSLTQTAVQQGLAHVVWNGRLQIVHKADDTATVLVDCAHNPHSAHTLVRALTDHFSYERLFLIFGAPADKDVVNTMAPLLPLAQRTIMTVSSHPRAAAPAALAEMAASLGYAAQVETAVDVQAALRAAWAQAQPGDLICVAGSIVVVGDFLNQWHNLGAQLLSPIDKVAPLTD